MQIEAGSVIILPDGSKHVVTETVDGNITQTEDLETYVAHATTVKYLGEIMTLHEVLTLRVDEFLNSEKVVHREVDSPSLKPKIFSKR